MQQLNLLRPNAHSLTRLLNAALLVSLLSGCFQTNLGGTTGSTVLTVAPLREPGAIVAEATTLGPDDWIATLGDMGWNDIPDALKLLSLGTAEIDTAAIDPEALYLVTASGGTDYAPDGRADLSGAPEVVQGSWHAIASGRRILERNMQVSALTEASYRQIRERLDLLTDSQVMQQLDAAARLLIDDVNRDDQLDHDDVLAFSRGYHAGNYLGDIAALDALATAVRAGQPAVALDQLAQDVLGSRRVVMDTSFGTIELETLNWETPVTVDNFLRYVEESFYDNVAFHRTIDGFLIQTGLWELLPGGATVAQKPPRDAIRNESRYSVSNARGTLSMARNADPDSANAQFFINQGDNDFLDYGSISNPDGFAVFARIISGLDVVDSIAGLPTGNVFGIGSDVPLTIVLIQSTVIDDE